MKERITVRHLVTAAEIARLSPCPGAAEGNGKTRSLPIVRMLE
jgi:hypothetical protein